MPETPNTVEHDETSAAPRFDPMTGKPIVAPSDTASFDPVTGKPLFDPMTGKPMARYDPKTGEKVHTTRTAFFPPSPAWGYLTIHAGWVMFNLLFAFAASTIPASDPNSMTSGEVVTAAIFFWAVGAAVIAWVNFFSRKVRHLP